MDPIPLVDLKAAWADIADEVEPIILDRLRSGDYLGADTIAAFEREFAAYVGGGVEAVACSSGTDAVELVTRACTGEGAIVACPSHTFVATVAGVERAGRTAVRYADAPEGGSAFFATWLYGSTKDAEKTRQLAAEYGVPLLEDCSQAHGNPVAGTVGVAGAWSLYPSKNLGAVGQCGVATFKDSVAAARARRMREHGYDRKHDRHFGRGWNLRADAVQCDVLRVKLKRLPGWVARRRAIAAAYHDGLRDVRGLVLPELEPTHAWHIFSLRVENRDAVLGKLRERGIGAAVHYRADAFGREDEWSASNLSLPMYPQMRDDQVARVIKELREVML